MSVLDALYRAPLALLTDLYQLTMAYAHWHAGRHEREAVFHLFYREPPFGSGPAIANGLHDVIAYLEALRFTRADLDYLAEQHDGAGKPLFEDAFLRYLQDLRFSGDVDAMPEGTAVFPHEPILRVQAPVIQAQMLETALLNLINFPTLAATKGARIARAAAPDPVLDFGMRKAHSPGAAVNAARAAYLGGCAGTANVLAGRLFDIPVRGTHAHGWVMAFDSELEAFDTYAEALPDNCIFLVDTYNTLTGVENAIAAGKKLRERGHDMAGIRLDSGDLGALAHWARAMLDAAGFPQARIAASSSLDEHAIADLKAAGAPIALWGVGTKLTTAQPDAALDGVYKLAAIRAPDGAWQYRIKLSDTPEKHTHPGIQQLRRYYDGDTPVMDLLFDTGDAGADFTQAVALAGGDTCTPPAGARDADLLVPVFRAGRCVYEPPALVDIRQHAMAEYAAFAGRSEYPVCLEGRLADLQRRLRARLE